MIGIATDIPALVQRIMPIVTADLYNPNINWLLDYSSSFDKIVHFGCNHGRQTLSLTWILHSHETIGIDIDKNSIQEYANNIEIYFRKDIERIIGILNQISNLSDNSLREKKLNEVHSYIYDHLGLSFNTIFRKFQNRQFPTYEIGDMTNNTKPSTNDFLDDNKYDLAFCEYVLNHIICKDGKRMEKPFLQALEEMVRVVKTNGLIVAIEPEYCCNHHKTPLQFHDFFNSINLNPLKIGQDMMLFKSCKVHAYIKSI